ncbi:dipeptide/oligopeptide/nickel ABC transporter permease/ATP-binding protein [Paractinoplanes atraurantiacus]|uniref:Oligopeptide/dipeptide ABC transporter, ATP-binding protein, C-terminal domain-containing protein n=1 Tax=Paractinoplanes atraurantiacus TaxID=1036182 RepID=A0A285HTB3_9ACTN|nr:dipeptide/oligopeptide/nickel ABC transporter permease/ATP-binding protein [Actinoplanes atraurantiacus]SNY37981.1 oligopeptide/dipeptide ABC transporter, ATP-binding protein, C-terminal domain-containing protein [Actinoplanes atraurantiacus]
MAYLKRPLGISAAVLLVLVLGLALVAPLLWQERADAVHPNEILLGPSSAHPVGTDLLGRDILARVLVATRLSVGLALLATAIGVGVGLLLGTAPTLLGRRVGRWITAVINIAVAFPTLLLALFFAVIFGVGAKGAVLAIGFATAPAFARLTQTLAATISGRDFIAAARVAGVGRMRILLRHVLPNIAEPLVVSATMAAGSALLAFASLSFLGLGVQAPGYDWGRLLGEGLAQIYIHPAGALAAGVAVIVAAMAFNLTGEAVARGLVMINPDKPRSALVGKAEPLPGGGLLHVENLRVSYGDVTPVRGVSLTVGAGEAVGIVGESGSGKSLTALAIAQLIESPGRVDADRIEFLGEDLRHGDHRKLLGTSLAMVFQDPMTSLNPTHKVGRQLAEVAREHQGATRRAAWRRAVDRLAAVRIPDAERRARQLPHEFSGGMRQRAMIGMGVMASPRLIIADEPTTALDVTVQRRVLELLADVRAAEGAALLFISHDVTVVGQVCDRVLVMYAGRVVEDLPTASLAGGALHPYTQALVSAVPSMTTDRDRPLAVIPGRPPDPHALPAGCAYAPRCPLATERCLDEDPTLTVHDDGRRVACWHAEAHLEGAAS